MADLAGSLIEELRRELREPGLDFAEAPAAISGGFDTRIFAFRLRGAPQAWSSPLVLRLLAPHHDVARVLVERVIQNTMADLGYPVPRVLLASADSRSLDGPWLVMERLRGRPLFQAHPLGMARVLVDFQLRLHALDAGALLQAMDREAPSLGRVALSFDRLLARLSVRVSSAGLGGLVAALGWLVEHRPREPARLAICHGDFHPQNILHDGRRVTGILDWPNAFVADPAYDVASTLVILKNAPIELAGAPAAVRWLVRFGRRVLVRRYLAGYRRRRPFDDRTLHYYEAASCMRGIVRTAEARLRRDGPANPLDESDFGDRLAQRFAEVSGVPVALPPP